MHSFHGSAVQTGRSRDGFSLLHHVLVFSWEDSLVGSDLVGSRWDRGFPGGSAVKYPPANAGTQVWSFTWQDPLAEEMATHCSILAWEIPWTEEPGGLQPMGSKKCQTPGQKLSLCYRNQPEY